MLNIVSRAAKAKTVGGQMKVFQNLVKGLDRIGYPFVVNRRLDACERLWIHDDTRALPLIAKLPPEIHVVVGPNLYVMPRDMPRGLDLRRATYLHPSDWAVEVWKSCGFDQCSLRAWPVGIDTDMFQPSPKEARKQVLVYHKNRDPAELARILATLESMGIEHQIIIYGNYSQDDYIRLLARSRYIIWHGSHESQGIGLQEAMACDVPILLWDMETWAQLWTGGGGCYSFNENEKKFHVTSAPYFDHSCGLRIRSLVELQSGIERMELEWRKFEPREYVLRNLSLEKQARELLAFYPEMDESKRVQDAIYARHAGKWRPPIKWVVEAVARRAKTYLGLAG